MMWHALPYVFENDRSGDYGLGFFGHSLESGAYYVHDPVIGEQCYLCDLRNTTASSTVHIVPRDSYRNRVYIEPLALYLQAQAGTFENLELNLVAQSLRVFDAGSTAPSAPFNKLRLKLSKVAAVGVRPGTNFRVSQPPSAAVVRMPSPSTPAMVPIS